MVEKRLWVFNIWEMTAMLHLYVLGASNAFMNLLGRGYRYWIGITMDNERW